MEWEEEVDLEEGVEIEEGLEEVVVGTEYVSLKSIFQ